MSRYRDFSGDRRSSRRDPDFRDSRYSGRSGGGRGFGGRSRAPAAKPSCVLGVFGLSRRTEERDLYDIMSQYGQLDDIQVVYDSLTGASRGFAFVYFSNLDDARAAHSACERGIEIHGRDVRVDYSLTEGPHKPTPGIYMGKDKRRPAFSDRRFGYHDRRRGRSRSSSPISPPRRRRYSSSRSRSPPPMRGRLPISRSPSPRMHRDGYGRPPRGAHRWSNGSPSPR